MQVGDIVRYKLSFGIMFPNDKNFTTLKTFVIKKITTKTNKQKKEYVTCTLSNGANIGACWLILV